MTQQGQANRQAGTTETVAITLTGYSSLCHQNIAYLGPTEFPRGDDNRNDKSSKKSLRAWTVMRFLAEGSIHRHNSKIQVRKCL